RAYLLRGLMFVHLKKDLNVSTVDWLYCNEPQDPAVAKNSHPSADLTPYGIVKNVQEKLSAIRTDLDSFSEVEAYALMASGYRMTLHDLGVQFKEFSQLPAGQWPFPCLEPVMQHSQG